MMSVLFFNGLFITLGEITKLPIMLGLGLGHSGISDWWSLNFKHSRIASGEAIFL